MPPSLSILPMVVEVEGVRNHTPICRKRLGFKRINQSFLVLIVHTAPDGTTPSLSLCFSLFVNPSIVPERLNFLVAFLQFDSALPFPCSAGVTAVGIPDSCGSALSRGSSPGIGVSSSEEDEEAVA